MVKQEPSNWSDDGSHGNDEMRHNVNSNDEEKEVAKIAKTDAQKVLKVLYGESLVDKKATPATKSRVSCDECNKTFRGSYELKFHTKSRHSKADQSSDGSDVKPFKCDLCSKSFASVQVLRRHRLIHSNEKPHACDLCSKKFKTIHELNYHKFTHSDKLPFPCDECDSTFALKFRLKKHKELVHRQIRAYKCDECEKSFKTNTDLVHHKNWHLGLKFHCNVCAKEFTRPEGLEKHKRTAHGGQEGLIKKFACDECGKVSLKSF